MVTNLIPQSAPCEAPLVEKAPEGRAPSRISRLEIGFGVISLLSWMFLLIVGIIIWSKPYRDKFLDPTKLTFAEALKYGLLLFLCYTVTNVALLCGLSSCLGALGRRARVAGNEYAKPSADVRTEYIGAVIRGFFVFILLLSGLIFIKDQPFDNITPSEYARLAGTSSVFGFLIGYDPRLFARICVRIKEWTEQHTDHPTDSCDRNGKRPD